MENSFKELKLFSHSEAAKVMSIGKERLNELIDQGKLGYIMLGDRMVIPYRAIEKYLHDNTLYYEQSEVNDGSDKVDLEIARSQNKKEMNNSDSKQLLNNILEAYNGKHISERR